LGLWKTAATPTLLACLIVRCSCNGQDGNLEFAALCVSKITAELETVEGRGENPSFHYETRALQIVDSSEEIAVVLTNILDQGTCSSGFHCTQHISDGVLFGKFLWV